MNVTVFTNGNDERLSKALQDVIEPKVSPQHLKVCHTIEDFSKRVKQLPKKINIAVLLTQSKHELLELVSLRDFLEDVHIILILPDRENETIVNGHKLRPRFISYLDDDFTNIGSVLEKMLKALDFRNYKQLGRKPTCQNSLRQ